MAPKRSAREPTPSSAATTQISSTGAGSIPAISKKAANNQSPQEIALGIWQNYLDTTPQRTKLIDVFMAFLVVVGVLQFVYCVIAGNYVCITSPGCVALGFCADFWFYSRSMPSSLVSRRRWDSLC